MSEVSTPSLSDIRADLLDWLCRDDCTPQKADWCIRRGLKRLNRDLRIPAMETDLVLSPTSADEPLVSIDLPELDTFLAIIRLEADGYPYKPAPLDVMPQGSTRCFNNGRYFARDLRTLVLGSPARQWVRLVYYKAFPSMFADTDTSDVLIYAYDALLFAALAQAGDVFAMPDNVQQAWEAKYQREVMQLNAVAQTLDTLGGPIAVSNADHYPT